MEGTVLVVRRAEMPQAGMGFVPDTLRKCDGEPRFADTRFAGNEHHAPFARLRLLPAPHKEFDFLVTSDERRSSGSQGRKPTYLRAFTQDAPRELRLAEA